MENFKIKTLDDIEKDYLAWLAMPESEKVNLSRWLPQMGSISSGFMPGHVVVIMGGTGVGKSAIIQNIIWEQKLPTFFFSCEMDEELLFERTIQIATSKTGDEVADDYREGREIKSKAQEGLKDCYFIFEHINIDDIIPNVQKWETENKKKLKIIAIDYLGYLKSAGHNRYEQTTYVSKQLKEIAKATNTVVFVLCQIHRTADGKSTDEIIPTLNSPKDSGDIENNCDYAIALYEPPTETRINEFCNLHVKMLKNRRGIKGCFIECIFDKKTLRISQL